MSIDIRFLQRLPQSFIEQNTPEGDVSFFRFLRDADSNHDFQLSDQELQRADSALQDPAQRERLLRTCAFIDESLRSGQVDIRANSPAFVLFSNRNPAGEPRGRISNWSHPHINRNGDSIIDRSEILAQLSNGINPRIDLLQNRLQRSSEGLLTMEANPAHRGLMNLLNIVTWLPYQITPGSADNLYQQIRIYAQRRHEIRLGVIDRLIQDLRNNPGHSIQDALANLSEQDRTVLIDDLQIQNWQYALTAATPQESIDAHLLMAEYLMTGRDSTYLIGGIRTLDEFLTIPWRAENYEMAQNILSALESSPVSSQLTPAQRQRLTQLRAASGSPNAQIVQSLPPANSDAQKLLNSLVRGVLDLVELPRQNSLNETTDFIATVAIEVFLLKGSVRAFKWGRAALGARATALAETLWSRIKNRIAPRIIANTGGQIAATGTVAAGSTALCNSNNNCVSIPSTLNTCAQATQRIVIEAAQRTGLQTVFDYARRGLGSIFTGLGWTIQTGTAVAGTALVTNVVIPPERHYTHTQALTLPEPDVDNAWVNANLASLALALSE